VSGVRERADEGALPARAGIVDAQKKAIQVERAEIAKEREKLKGRIVEAKSEARKEKIIQNLKETVRQLRRGTTPQTGSNLRTC
jgi:ribulose kinase